ncbi:F-box domain-containing protein [Phlyctema vagabunda]|uniref:F-box domain-containing protein n=1 Tax=Phlyctema vagabunda TaxID=108571 RepID=A0ABR4PD77_9HELO
MPSMPPTKLGSVVVHPLSFEGPNRLPIEVIQYMYGFLPIKDILALSQTCQRFHMAYIGHQIPILHQAVTRCYSPISDVVKLVCANEPDMRPRAKLLSARNRAAAHVRRVIQIPEHPILTLDMIIKICSYGEVARKWVEIWPRLRWREDSDNRRLLRPHEQVRLRQAIYRSWTYNSLFHHSPFHPSVVEDGTSLISTRPWSDDPRLSLLRTYSTLDLVQLYEFCDTMHQVIAFDLCPSTTTILERCPQQISAKSIESMSWGEGYPYQRLVLILEKLRPRELLHLFENTTTKAERMNYLIVDGGHLRDTPSTLQPAIEIVTRGRRFHWRERDKYGKEIGWGITDIRQPDHYDFVSLSRDANPDGAWPFPLSDDAAAAADDSDSDGI